jgi:dTDP-4-amino-4,6-dideoxygalactose transaminase
MTTIELATPVLGEPEVDAVSEVLRSGWLTMGPRTAEFEKRFAELVQTEHAVMTSSCTAALHLALLALDVGPGAEVIVPSLTFVATASAVSLTGAQPVLADITDLDRPVLDPAAVLAAITPRTMAIIAVHYAGYPADMQALRQVAGRHGLALIEDAAHAPGASAPEGPVGSLGDLACFSFFSNKNLVTGEGGMVTTQDEALAARVRRLRAHGLTASTWDRQRGLAAGYDVPEVGANYRPSEIEAALGLVQLGRLAHGNARRRDLVALYRELLGDEPGWSVPFAADEDARSACHILAAIAPSPPERDDLRARCAEQGIQTSMHYPPVHSFAAHASAPGAGDLPVTEEFASREVTLPLHPLMSDGDVACVTALTATTTARS